MARKHLKAGDLRHLVSIEKRSEYRDSVGDVHFDWVPISPPVFASIEDLSAREFLSAQAIQSEITTRITIRALDGVDSTMRIVHGATVYNIHGVLRDLDSRQEYMTLPCSEGVSDGE